MRKRRKQNQLSISLLHKRNIRITREIPPPPPPPPSSQTPTQQTPHTVSTIKLPILKRGEYDIWAMKMEHYLAHTDYPIWEVIQNGNGHVSITTDTSGQIKVLPSRTAEDIVARERDRKAMTTLLMALPEDHLAKNDESKKMQKYILKKQFEGFSVSNTEGLHKGYDRFQSLLSQLEIHGAGLGTNDEYYLEEIDLMEVAMISMRMKRVEDTKRLGILLESVEPREIKITRRNARNPGTKEGTRTERRRTLNHCSESNTEIDLDDKTDVLTYHKKLLAEAQKEKEDLKAKVEKWHNSSKNLSKLLNTQMSANDKFGLGYGDHRYDGILSYENEVLQSVFMNKESELEKQPLYDRFVTARGMHAVPPPMTGNYMPSGPDIEVDYSQFTYGPKQTQPSESESQTSEFDTCDSNISTKPSELVSKPVVNESNVECQPKVWSDAPIIEEYESDSEDEETVKNQFTHSQKPKVDKKELGYGFTVRACFVCGSLNHLIRDCDFHEKRMARKAELNNGWNNVQRVNKQNQFVPSAVLTITMYKRKNKSFDELEKLKRQEKEAKEEAKALRKDMHKNRELGAVADFTNLETVENVSPITTSRIISSHPSALILGDPTSAVQTRTHIKIQIGWILGRISASEEAIGTKWVYQNKKDKRGVVVRNKARLVAQGHRQEEDSLKKTQNSDYARANLDRKSTTGEAEYVAASKLLWASFCGSKSNVKTMDDKVADPTNQEAFELNGRIATSQNNNNSRHIIAKVAGKPVSISDASIRSDLLFDDANGIDSLPNQTIFDAIQLMRSQLANSTVPLYHFPVNALTNEGSPFRKPSEAQPTPSLTHPSEVPIVPQTDSSPTHPSEKLLVESWEVSDQAKEIQYLKAPIKKLKKQAKPIIKHHRAWMQSGRKFAKGEPSVHKDPLFDEIPEETLDNIETENAQDVGRTSDIVGEEKEKDKDVLDIEDVLSTNKEKLNTDKEKVSTDRPIVSTDEQRKDSDDHTEEGSATQTTQPPPTSTIFRDDETIAKVLLNMSQAKAVSREKEKGVELKDIEETDRPRPTSTRSLLTLKPLLKIDPKDKGKKKIEEEDETKSESNGIPEAEKKFKQLASDEEMARKIQEDPCIEKIKRSDEDFISIGSAEDERLIKKMNEKGIDSSKNEMIKEESKEEDKEETPDEEKEVDKAEHLEEINQNVVIRSMYKKHFSTLMRVLSIFDRDDLNAIYQLVMDKYQDEIPKGFDRAGLVIHMLVEKKYHLRKKVLLQMLELKLESEEDSTMALELIRFVKKLVAELEPEDSNGDEEDL
ncbi:ribonuclease H-like domain-containing protein [Tanacetum coccineum]